MYCWIWNKYWLKQDWAMFWLWVAIIFKQSVIWRYLFIIFGNFRRVPQKFMDCPPGITGFGWGRGTAPTDPMHNPLVFLDWWLLLEKHVTVMAKRAFSQLHIRCQLCLFLDQGALLIVIHTLVTSQLDYCNALSLGLLLKTIWKL